MKTQYLLAWIGGSDCKAAKETNKEDPGPIARIVSQAKIVFTEIVILWDKKEEYSTYIDWLREFTKIPIIPVQCNLSSPTNYEEIYDITMGQVQKLVEKDSTITLNYCISSGTPAMKMIWILISSQYPGNLLESSREQGVKILSLPFKIFANRVSLANNSFQQLSLLAENLPTKKSKFEEIIYSGQRMSNLVTMAKRVALFCVPVLILGESGTGKELFARAIHDYSPRQNGNFVPVNCASIPDNLLESEFFGYVKGAFTNANKNKEGFFEAASQGTLFLDEIGELPLYMHSKLLRALQEQQICKLGDPKPLAIDVRIIAATNKNLLEDTAKGKFREDLFYRLAVAVLKVPPLREHPEDIRPIGEYFLKQLNQDFKKEFPSWQPKKLTEDAWRFLESYPWKGNVRELHNILVRSLLWIPQDEINSSNLLDILLEFTYQEQTQIPHITHGFNLQEYLEKIEQKCIEAALSQTGGNQNKAADLLGMKSHQNLANRLKKLNLKVKKIT